MYRCHHSLNKRGSFLLLLLTYVDFLILCVLFQCLEIWAGGVCGKLAKILRNDFIFTGSGRFLYRLERILWFMTDSMSVEKELDKIISNSKTE